jgi:hypothetical protein
VILGYPMLWPPTDSRTATCPSDTATSAT